MSLLFTAGEKYKVRLENVMYPRFYIEELHFKEEICFILISEYVKLYISVALFQTDVA